MEQRTYGELDVQIASSNAELGEAAAAAFAETVTAALADHDRIAVILATGNSQLSFIQAIRRHPHVDWSRITVLHMDEYLGMSDDHPASFRRWMREKLLDHTEVDGFHGMAGDHEPIEEEVRRYSGLLQTLEPVVCVMGIGENGHLAFNDPPADFDTDDLVHVVELDEPCRMQQVSEGHFPDLDATPTRAVSLTIPALLRPSTVLVLCPEERKAEAVRRCLTEPVSPDRPASILTTVPHARLYLDHESASLLE